MKNKRDILKMLDIFNQQEIDFLACFECNNYFENKDIVINFDIPEGVPFYLLEKINYFNNQNTGVQIKINIDNKKIKHEFLYDYLNNFLKPKNNILLKSILNRQTFKCDSESFHIVYWTKEELDAWTSIESELINFFKNILHLQISKIVFIEDPTHINGLNELKKQQEKEHLNAIQNYKSSKNNSNDCNSVSKTFKQTYKFNKKLTEPAIKIIDINHQDLEAVIEGKIFKKDVAITKNDTHLYKFYITDYTSSLAIKGFSKGSQEQYEKLENGVWIKVKVKLMQDKFEFNNTVGSIVEFYEIEPLIKDFDDSERKRVELCVHTKMSAYDGLVDVNNLMNYLKKSNIKSVGITDRNNVQIYPDLAKATKKNEIKPLYGYQIEVLDDTINAVLNPTSNKIANASYVIFDLETTGLYAHADEIIEFGAVKYENGNAVERIDFFIKTKEPIQSHTTELTNITNEMVQNGLEPMEAYQKIINFIGNSVLVAHNGINFDFNFLNVKLKEHGFNPLKNTMVDSMVISRSINAEFNSNTLGYICRKYHIEYDEAVAHRADYDAEVLYHVYKIMINKMSELGIETFEQINEKIQNDSLRSKSRGDDILIYVKNQAGVPDLYELISIASTTNYYKRPTLTWKIINEKRNNLLVANAPIDGEIFNGALNYSDEAFNEIAQRYDFLTIAPSDSFKHLIDDFRLTLSGYKFAIEKILKFGSLLDKKVCATSDPYYIFQFEKKYHDVYIFTPGLNGRKHRYYKFETHPEQHIFSGDEMKFAFSYLNDNDLINKIVFDNPDYISNLIDDNIEPLQKKLFAPEIPGVNEKVTNYVYKTAHDIYGENLPEIVESRIKKELDAIIGNGYAVVYWISHLLVKESLNDGYVVGSRGSVGSSLVATLLNITDVNPLGPHYLCRNCHYVEFIKDREDGYDLAIKECPNCHQQLYGEGHSIPFETFLGFKGDKVPDIDLNFSGVYQPKAHNFIKKMFGDTHAFRAGTIATVAEKTSYGYVRNYFESQFNDDLINNAEIERYACNCIDVKRTTGQHPGGIVVVPKDKTIYDFTPYNYPADDTTQDWFTTHFAFEAIHDNLLKFDILGHDNPTALKMLKDLTGVDEKDIPNQDEKVMELFRSCEPMNIKPNDILGETTGALSLPEFGTSFVRGMLKETQPKHFSDLIRISGLSHGTDVWLGNAQSLIKQGHTLENVIGCRDDIMVYLLSQNVPPSKAFSIMEDVRKGKQIKKDDEALLREYKIPEWWIESANKIKYMFPKAHATAYVMHAWKFAYYKLYYPLEYYAAWFSIRPSAFDLEIMVENHAKIKARLEELIKINNSPTLKSTLTTKQKDLIPVLEILLEMKARKFEFLQVDLNRSSATEFLIDYEKNAIIAPFICVDSLGETVAQSIIQARNEKIFSSQDDLSKRTKLTKQHMENLTKLGILKHLPKNDQVSLFDELF